jgi:hypothetical protein
VVVEGEEGEQAEDDQGWTVLATPVGSAGCTEAEIFQAYHNQQSTGEPGCRWSKNPAAITPVWREKPERIAA